MISRQFSVGIIILILALALVATVSAEPPKIQLVVKPTEGTAPLTIQFSEDSGDSSIVTWLWNFGNGDSFEKQSGEYIYDKPGEYNLILSVWNDKGESATDKVTVVVKEWIEPTPELTIDVTPEPTPIIEEIPVRVVYEGATPIKDALVSKSSGDKTESIGKAIEIEMKKQVYPYTISNSITNITIVKCRYDSKMQTMGYWIEATRGGREVAVDNPIWIVPAPYEIVVNETYDNIANEKVITIREDPKEAVEIVLTRYVDMQSIGKAIVGTKE
jgi:PKD repeat protein